MAEHVAVEILPDLPHVVAVLIEFEIARLLGAGVDEDMPLGVGGDPMPSPMYTLGGQLHEVVHHFELDIGRVFRALGRSLSWAGERPPGGAWAPPGGVWAPPGGGWAPPEVPGRRQRVSVSGRTG